MENETEINKMKAVLLAIWDGQRIKIDKNNLEACEIIEQFRKEIDEINRGN